MRYAALIVVGAAAFSLTREARTASLPVAVPNDNRTPAGHRDNGVLELALEAKLTMWHPDGDSLPGIPVEAFAEQGKAPLVPGPLIRITQGTAINLSVRNTLSQDTITYSVDIGDRRDSVVIPPGSSGTLRVRPASAGTFFYRATTSTTLGRALGVGGLLAGAVIVDPAGAAGPSRERILVMQVAADRQIAKTGIPFYPRSVWAINGRSWPHTERLDAAVGDTVRWRVINIGTDTHPMHLHGFYYAVNAVDGPAASLRNMEPPSPQVVTTRLGPFASMFVTWVPQRDGNWLFHCHLAAHLVPHGELGGESPASGIDRIAPWPARVGPADATDHAAGGMAGLIMGITVRGRAGARFVPVAAARRILRLVALQDPEFPDSQPSLRFVLDDPRDPRRHAEAWPGLSVPINLTRGEPVAITVVNRMHEPTSVHWHGIELDSYADGVPGFSGSGMRLAPLIAPGDSFVARFTPPRAGTFIYHSHIDEPRQQRAGLVGALIVRDASYGDTARDLTFLFKLARYRNNGSFEINGKLNPDTVRLRVGQRYRIRLIALQNEFPNIVATITARADSVLANVPDSQVVQWTPLAKDGADLPEHARARRQARQVMSMGETYDFEFSPERVGNFRLELRKGTGLVARTPIVVY